jgi:hypothetical protein
MRLKMIVCALLAGPALAGAQTLPELRIDMSSASAAVPRELQVDDSSRVRVSITKNAFHSCSVELKTEALPAPPNPVAQILGVLGGFIGGAGREAGTGRAQDELEAQVILLDEETDRVVAKLKEQIVEVESIVRELPKRVACDADMKDKNNPCLNATQAQVKLDTLAEDLQNAPTSPIVSTTLVSSRAAELAKALTGRMVAAKPGEGEWLKNAFARLRLAQEKIDYATEKRSALVKARDALLVIRERIIGFTPSTNVVYPLSPASNARTVATITCLNVVTQQPAIYRLPSAGAGQEPNVTVERIAPVSASVVFRNMPWATVSGGMLYSLVDKRQITVASNKTGTDAAGVVTFDRRVAETGTGGSQIVPFTYFNVVIPRMSRRTAYAAGSIGFGLNPNNGSKTLEYFLGGAVGIGRFVVINVGAHLGTRMEPDNNFAVGDVLPVALTAVPTRRDRETKFAIGVSYGLPLPK